MCRILAVRALEPFWINPLLESFTRMCHQSSEYQGDGWGISVFQSGKWKRMRFIEPIWESKQPDFGYTDVLLIHARSAFERHGVDLDFNMPFGDERTQFLFNGEIHGVRLNVKGQTGAEKIFNLLKRFDKGNWFEALRKTYQVIEKRSRFIKAANILFADKKHIWGATLFSEEPDYFTLWKFESTKLTAVCSHPLACLNDWEPIPNRSIFELGG